MVEVHPTPDEALSDGAQSLNLAKFRRLMKALRPIVESVGRELG